jgi:hypothetical protein
MDILQGTATTSSASCSFNISFGLTSALLIFYLKCDNMNAGKEKANVETSTGFVRQKRGKTVPSFIKQRWNIDGIFLPPFFV